MAKTCRFRGVGALLGALSGFCYAVCGTSGKILQGSIDPIMISWACSFFVLISSGLFVLILGVKFWSYSKEDHVVILLIGLINGAFLVAQYYAFQLTNLSDAITLTATSPLFLIIINCIFRREGCRLTEAFVVVTTLVGVVCCAQPQFIFETGKLLTKRDFLGYSLALLVAFFWAVFFILMDKVKHVDITGVVFLENVYSMICMSVLLLVFKAFDMPNTRNEYIYVVLVCLSNLFAVLLSYVSVIYDNPLMASIGRTSDISVSIVLNYVVFHVMPNAVNIIGGLMIMMSIVLPSLITLCKSSNYDDVNNLG